MGQFENGTFIYSQDPCIVDRFSIFIGNEWTFVDTWQIKITFQSVLGVIQNMFLWDKKMVFLLFFFHDFEGSHAHVWKLIVMVVGKKKTTLLQSNLLLQHLNNDKDFKKTTTTKLFKTNYMNSRCSEYDFMNIFTVCVYFKHFE